MKSVTKCNNGCVFCAVCYYTYMQNIIVTQHSVDALEKLLPCLGEEGQDVYPSKEAVELAHGLLQAPQGALLRWNLPDVFDIRYGSSWAGSVRYEDKELRFHNNEDFKNFKEEDMDCWSNPWKK